MTKYELYQILDENGFEPSEENLETLIEGLEDGTYAISEDGMLYEGIIGNIVGRVAAHRDMKAAKAEATGDTEKAKKLRAKADKVTNFASKHRILGKSISKGYAAAASKVASHENQRQEQNKQMSAARETMNKVAHQAAVSDNNAEKSKTAAEKVDGRKADVKSGEIVQTKAPVVKEDYELYQILDENGFEPSEENLSILKEMIDSNEVLFMESSELVLTENTSADDVYTQLLTKNGFKVTENNISVLKEAIENGHVLLVEEGKTKILTDGGKKKLKKVAKLAASIAIGAAVGGAAGAGIAKGTAEKKAAKAAEAATSAEASSSAAAENVSKAEGELAAAKEAGDAEKASTVTKDLVASEETAKKAAEEAEKAKTASTVHNNDTVKKVKTAAGAAGGAVVGGAAGAVVGSHLNKEKKEEEAKDAKKKVAK